MKIGKTDLGNYPVLLAPLEDITDLPYRLICKSFGADLVYTEFVSSEALVRGVDKSLEKLKIKEEERPVAIQIFGHDENNMRSAAAQAAKLKPDLIDINWGCPVKKVVAKGAGAAILKDIPKMVRITKAVVDATDLPVTVKTRLGWDQNNKPIVEVAERLQDVGIQAISIHGRTRSQMYGGAADWTLIKKIKENPNMFIPVIGNGDIDSPQSAREKFEQFGVDAIMIGRAAIGNPWIFMQIKEYLNNNVLIPGPSVKERLNICRKHLLAEVAIKGEEKAVIEMRKQYAKYFKGVVGFKRFRMKLVITNKLDETESIFQQIEKNYCPD